MAKIGVIGGGPAGLGLTYRLSRAGHAVTLFEAAPEFGGLARSFDFAGVRIERYYHFLCSTDDEYFSYLEHLGLTSRLRWSNTQMGFFHDGAHYPFNSGLDLLRCSALSLGGRIRYGTLALRSAMLKDWRPLDGIPAKNWLIRQLGPETYRATWQPLLEVKFHKYHDQISAAWVWHRIHRVARSRGKLMQRERLGYLEGGTYTLLDGLIAASRQAGARLVSSAPIARILHESRRCSGLETRDGTRHSFDFVVSTVPLPVFLDMASGLPCDYLARLRTIDFIGVVCVLLRLRRPVSGNFWLNVNDERVPFNGCIEYTNLNPAATTDGTSLLYVPYYLPRSDQRYRFSDERNIADTLAALRIINPSFSPESVVGAVVSRDPYAQVICRTGFAGLVPPHRTPLERLYLVESSQLYPADRTISGALGLSSKVTEIIERECR